MRHRTPYVPTGRRVALAAEDARFGRRGTDKPIPGFYAWRFRKGAPEVGCEIAYGPTLDPDTGEALDRPYWWSVRISGHPDINPGLVPGDTVWSVYIFGRRIERAEYEFLVADRQWAAEHAPDLPEAKPRESIRLSAMPPLF